MTTQESKKFGGQLIMRASFLLFVVIELIYMFNETQGDFANGILFFIDSQLNIYFLLFLLLYFSTLYLFGRKAGHEIIIKKRRYLLVGFLFGIISAIVVMIYFSSSVLLLNNSIDRQFNKEHESQIINSFIRNFLIFLFAIVSIWLWAANRMDAKVVKP